MTRRALLGFLAAAAVDPERLIWEPGRKLISIPAPASSTFFLQSTRNLLFHPAAFVFVYPTLTDYHHTNYAARRRRTR